MTHDGVAECVALLEVGTFICRESVLDCGAAPLSNLNREAAFLACHPRLLVNTVSRGGWALAGKQRHELVKSAMGELVLPPLLLVARIAILGPQAL